MNGLPSRRSFTRGASISSSRAAVVTLRDRATPLRTTSAWPPRVPLLGVRRHVRVDLRLQRHHQHPPGAFTDQRGEVQLEAGSVLVFNDYAPYGRALLGRPLSRPGSCQTGGYATLLTPTSIHSFALYPDLWF